MPAITTSKTNVSVNKPIINLPEFDFKSNYNDLPAKEKAKLDKELIKLGYQIDDSNGLDSKSSEIHKILNDLSVDTLGRISRKSDGKSLGSTRVQMGRQSIEVTPQLSIMLNARASHNVKTNSVTYMAELKKVANAKESAAKAKADVEAHAAAHIKFEKQQKDEQDRIAKIAAQTSAQTDSRSKGSIGFGATTKTASTNASREQKEKEAAIAKVEAEAKYRAEQANKAAEAKAKVAREEALEAKKAYEARVNIDLKHGLTETELAFIKDLGYAHGKYFGYTKDGKKVDAKEIQAVVKLRRDTHQAAVAALPAANENNHKAAQAADAAKVAWLRAGDAVAKAATVKSSIEINPKVSQTVLNALETNDKELKTSITTAAAATQAAQKLDIALEYYKSIKDNSTIKDDQKKLAYDQTIKARDEATSKHAVAETALGISQKALKALTDAQQAYSDARNKRDKAIQEATTVYNQALKTHEETQKTYETTMTAAKAATEAVTKAEQATTDKAIDAATKIKLNERAVTPAKK